MSVQDFFSQMQAEYHKINKIPEKVFHLLQEKTGNQVTNDHIALRTFNDPKIGIDKLAEPFIELGYKKSGDYVFEEKKLIAIHLEHEEPLAPKVFISELEVEKFSERAQKIIAGLIEQIGDLEKPLCFSGRPWNVSWDDYSYLAEESEYASWMAAHGFIANHFTVSLNHLPVLQDIKDLNQFLKDNGYNLNANGGEVKGSKEDLLEQSSTVAELVKVEFKEGAKEVPGCFIEFARRHKDASGSLFQGFVPNSANKIFESTNTDVAGQRG